MKNHEESAKYHMVERVSIATESATVADAIKKLQDPKMNFDTVDYTFILDSQGKLKGVISIKELLNAPDKNKKITTLMKHNPVVAHPSTDQERVAHIALKNNIKAVPIVDKDHKFLGVVPSDVILKILSWEHGEDMLRLAGIHDKGKKLNNLLQFSFLKISRIRIPSLLIGLLGGLLTTKIVSFYHTSLEQELVLAFFIPIIVYLSAAVGQQSQTILIRSLALEEINLFSYALREMAAGLLIGCLIGGLMSIIVFIWFASLPIAMIIGISLIFTIITATIVAVTITGALVGLKKDPAIAGGPFATVIQDILSLVIYFSVASMFLK